MTLVIIDMQYDFKTAHCSRTVKSCEREIKSAIVEKQPIIFVELSGFGSTINQLTNLVRDYDLYSFVKKCGDNGAREVLAEIHSKKWPIDMRVCGINANFCVQDTVLSLPNPVVVADAINCWHYNHHDELGYEDVEHHKHVLKSIQKYTKNIDYGTLVNL